MPAAFAARRAAPQAELGQANASGSSRIIPPLRKISKGQRCPTSRVLFIGFCPNLSAGVEEVKARTTTPDATSRANAL